MKIFILSLGFFVAVGTLSIATPQYAAGTSLLSRPPHLSVDSAPANIASPLDTRFGSGGIVTTPLGIGNDVPQAIAVQTDGRIVVAGYAFNGSNNDFALVRYEPNGTLDQSFHGGSSAGGIVFTAFGGSEDEAFGLAVQPDGKIVAVGQTYDGIRTDIAVARYLPDGRLDDTFDIDGRRTIRAGTGNALARSVAVQADGRIVVAGVALNGGNFDIAVVRLLPDGSPDSSFAGNSGVSNGVVLTQVGAGNDQAYAVAARPDGKIVIAGYYVATVSTDTVLLRYASDGRLDPEFGSGGIARHTFSSADTDEALSMVMRPDGKLVIAGCIRTPGVANDFLIARFNDNGSRDASFGTDGFVRVAFSSGTDIGLGIALQDNGKAVAAGFGYNGQDNDFAVTRVDTDGLLDPTFGDNGRALTMVGTNFDVAYAVAVQPDGKFVVAGRTVGTTSDFGIVRYRAEAASISGRVVTPTGLAIRNARVNLIDANGLTQTVATGSFGSFRFDGIPTGQMYTVTIGSKRYRFAPRVLPFTESLAGVDFVGLE